jgi:hypothetical protein
MLISAFGSISEAAANAGAVDDAVILKIFPW